MENTYYKDQLDKINPYSSEFPAQLKLNKDGIQTHWIALNDESATELFLWLRKHFNLKDEGGYL